MGKARSSSLVRANARSGRGRWVSHHDGEIEVGEPVGFTAGPGPEDNGALHARFAQHRPASNPGLASM